ncbi:MAG TPA: adenylyltransferase/cytidyltransferase family protein, partial [Defluviitaleaceae bacterium]|nr:adenylyltransferase/cytidyltransferase family protein [Defluviitaleaceae bacterium]
MRYLTNLNSSHNKASVITIGNFDGLHLGHRKLIYTVKKLAIENAYESIVFSFHPHPHKLLNKKD